MTQVPDKLYIVCRRDIGPGRMLAQTCHALSEFESKYKTEYNVWYRESNYIICLEVDDEETLKLLMGEAKKLEIKTASFYEPDLDEELTAVTFEPGALSKRLLRKLPLALRGLH